VAVRSASGYRSAVIAPANDLRAAARPGSRIGHRVELHATIGSTNDRARALLAEPDGEGVAVVAEEQLSGRGRRGRTWSSPPGVNLLVSVGLRPDLAARDAWQLGQAVALAARSACSSAAPVELKWPNDLVTRDGRKIGGLLVETAIDGDRLAEAVVGIGLNVNWLPADMPSELAASASSLSELAGATVDRAQLLRRLLAALEVELAGVEAGSSPLDRYRAACRTLGTTVEVDLGGRLLRGTAVDVDATGALVLRTDDGPVAIASGEVVRAGPTVPA
jgi:BirA family transcriptional regulator, biotin operon repressor / biotin---[acetyl-CoA-carboxylase] ligase